MQKRKFISGILVRYSQSSWGRDHTPPSRGRRDVGIDLDILLLVLFRKARCRTGIHSSASHARRCLVFRIHSQHIGRRPSPMRCRNRSCRVSGRSCRRRAAERGGRNSRAARCRCGHRYTRFPSRRRTHRAFDPPRSFEGRR